MSLRERTRPGLGIIEPCLPSPAKAPPSGPSCIHEIKHNGFRILARRDNAGVWLITRAGNDFSSDLANIETQTSWAACPDLLVMLGKHVALLPLNMRLAVAGLRALSRPILIQRSDDRCAFPRNTRGGQISAALNSTVRVAMHREIRIEHNKKLFRPHASPTRQPCHPCFGRY